MRRLFDVTLPFRPGLPTWPGEPGPAITRLQDMARGDPCTVTRIDFAVHYGTHLDAPAHFVEGGAGVEALALDTLIGPCRVVRIPEAVAAIGPAELEAADLPAGTERVLFRTGNSALWDDPCHPFFQDFSAFTPEGAHWLVARGVRLVGIDYLSVQRFADPGPDTHRILLAAGVVAVEGLDLRGVDAGAYLLYCLPLKLEGGDGAPCRVVLDGPLDADTEMPRTTETPE